MTCPRVYIPDVRDDNAVPFAVLHKDLAPPVVQRTDAIEHRVCVVCGIDESVLLDTTSRLLEACPNCHTELYCGGTCQMKACLRGHDYYCNKICEAEGLEAVQMTAAEEAEDDLAIERLVRMHETQGVFRRELGVTRRDIWEESVCEKEAREERCAAVASRESRGEAGVCEETSVFEFCLFFWAPSEAEKEKVAKCALEKRVEDYKETTRGESMPEEKCIEVAMRWALSGADISGKHLHDFDLVDASAAVNKRVFELGQRLCIDSKLKGVYELELGSDFEEGLYVPSLMSSGLEKANTCGPFVGLRRMEDLSSAMMYWAKDMGWVWNDDEDNLGGDPHGLLRAPFETTMRMYKVDNVPSRTCIRIASVSGAIGAGKHGLALPTGADLSDVTAPCVYTSETGQVPRVADGVLEVFVFRIRLPEGRRMVFSDFTQCVVCLSAESDHANVGCGHVCLCHACYLRMRGDPCPLCRENGEGVVLS